MATVLDKKADLVFAPWPRTVLVIDRVNSTHVMRYQGCAATQPHSEHFPVCQRQMIAVRDSSSRIA
jgi:hypothetical protein